MSRKSLRRLLKIPLSPPAAGRALAARKRKISRAWDALSNGALDAIGFEAAGIDDIPSGSTETAPGNPFAEAASGSDHRFGILVGPSPTLLLPGSFNPLHEGHRRMLDLASTLMDQDNEELRDTGVIYQAAPGFEPTETPGPAFELSIENVDKPPLDALEAAARLAHFAHRDALWLTRSATFSDKAHLFPGATFAVGADTIVRIGDVRYYKNAAARNEAMHALRRCRFLVFGRTTGDRFHTLSSLDLPAQLRRLCQEIPAESFRIDLSSTSLRQAR